ncbi:MAG TPA: hypothetical protein VGD64_07290, partial [Acidisarcina sp.]
DLRYERQVVLEMAKDAQVGSAASTPSGTTMPASTAPSIEEGGPAAVLADTSSRHHATSGMPGKSSGKTLETKHLSVRHLSARGTKADGKRAEYHDAYPVATSVVAPKIKPYAEARPATRTSAAEKGAVQ